MFPTLSIEQQKRVVEQIARYTFEHTEAMDIGTAALSRWHKSPAGAKGECTALPAD